MFRIMQLAKIVKLKMLRFSDELTLLIGNSDQSSRFSAPSANFMTTLLCYTDGQVLLRKYIEPSVLSTRRLPEEPVADPEILKRGGWRQSICPVVIYRKCAWWTIYALYGKSGLLKKSNAKHGGGRPHLWIHHATHDWPTNQVAVS